MKNGMISKSLAEKLLYTMLVGREFEDRLQNKFDEGVLHGTTHLAIGEEGAAVGSVIALEPEDYMLATHRGHVQAIAKGASTNAIMAEMLGKQDGICGGKGGSMHLADFSKGILGTNGIVGANAPIACGAAFSSKYLNEDKVTLCFFGDGASNQGSVHEAMNIAATWDLPIIFFLVNNTYGISTHISDVTKESDLTKRAVPYGMKSLEIDGNDVVSVYETVRDAREYVKEEGPILIVAHTYRISGHSKSDENVYRSHGEINKWKNDCPIDRFKTYISDNNLLNEQEVTQLENKAVVAVDKAVEFAQQSPKPAITSLLEDVYR